MHPLDNAPDWLQFSVPPAPQGTAVTIEGIGRFRVGDPKQIIHKRLSRGVPWELPIAVLLMELAARCNPDSLIVDVGANIGAITVPMAKASAARIIAFEPEPGNYRIFFTTSH